MDFVVHLMASIHQCNKYSFSIEVVHRIQEQTTFRKHASSQRLKRQDVYYRLNCVAHTYKFRG